VKSAKKLALLNDYMIRETKSSTASERKRGIACKCAVKHN